MAALLIAAAGVWIGAVRAGEPPTSAGEVRAIPATGFWSDAGKVLEGFDPAFARGFYGWTGSKSGSAAAYHFVVQPSGHYLVALGFFDPNTKPGIRLQDVVIDGRQVDTLDPAGPRPFVRLYEVSDLNGDGYIQVSCSQAQDETGATGLMNIVWLFAADQKGRVDVEELARGRSSVKPLFRLDTASEDRNLNPGMNVGVPVPSPGIHAGVCAAREHVNYPRLPEAQLKRMLPLRPVALDISPARPQPVDPLHLEIQGELRGRIQAILDRWGNAGRDQKLVARFLADAGFDTSARALEVYCLFSRLLKIDLELQVPFEALLARQQQSGDLAGAFTGGTGPPRLACSWEQGTLLQAMLAYYEHSGGDPRALEAARWIVDWEDRMTSGKIEVGSWGGSGRFGALEPLVTYAWRTKEPQALEIAKRIAEVNRGTGGIRWLIRGERSVPGPGVSTGASREHMHSCLTTVRGFPWLYAYTADRSYLDDAIAACDRVYDTCTWANGSVAEFTDPDAKHCFPNDETCCLADEIMLSLHLADLTGQGRFFDRADVLYYNALRFNQWFQGDFNCYNDPHVGLKGPHAWYCCTWWGAKALYETARHLYASSPTEVYVNGFMPSQAELPLKDGLVGVVTEAKIPDSGDVRITVTPEEPIAFTLNVRVPGWAVLRTVEVNGQTQPVQPSQGHLSLRRGWCAGDRVDLHFDLPLRVELDDGQGPTPLAEGQVSLDGAPPVAARSIVIYRGPVILAQFRLQNGCDLIWAYSGDDPYLFETVASAPDEFVLGGQPLRPTGTPNLVRIAQTAAGVRLEWSWKTGPARSWEVRRSALVKPGIPVQIEYLAEVTAPPGTPAEQIDEVVRTGRFCGTRMPYSVSAPSTYFDKTGHLVAPRIVVDGAVVTPAEKQWLPAKNAELDNGSVRYQVESTSGNPVAGDEKQANYSAIYSTIGKENGHLAAKCRLTVTGRGQFD